MPEILFVVAHDSQFKWAGAAAAPFRRAGWQIRFFAPTEHTKISEGQIGDAGVPAEEVIQGRVRESVWRLAEADAVVFVTPGGITERNIYRLRQFLAERGPEAGREGHRPVIATAYVGMIIDNHVAGYLYRAPVDFACVNSPHDLALFAAAGRELGLPEGHLELTGLSIIGGEIRPQKEGPIRRVVFADQVALPAVVGERKYVYQQLVEYAGRHPDRQVIVKPRHRPEERSFHQGEFPPEAFFTPDFTAPPNLTVDYTPVSELLPETDLLLTLSSTAALEAIAHGVRVAILADVGVQERHGNTLFIGSGLIRTFAQIARDEIGRPDPDWIASFQYEGPDPVDVIFAAVTRRLEAIREGRLPLPEAPYFTARRQFLADFYGFNTAPAKPVVKKAPAAKRVPPVKKKVPVKRAAPPPRSGPRALGRALLPPVLVLPVYRLGRRIGLI